MPTYQGAVPDFDAINGGNREEILGKSHYYWWFMFLRESDSYQRYYDAADGASRLARVWDQFGDVRYIEFENWWKEKGEYLFADRTVEEGLVRICAGEDWKQRYEQYPHLVLVLDSSRGVAKIRKDIESYLRGFVGTMRGRPKKGAKGFTARFPITGVIQLRRVQEMHKVLVASRNISTDPRKSFSNQELVAIGRAARIRLIERTTPRPAGDVFEDADFRTRYAAKISSIIFQARKLCTNVSRGYYPNVRGPSLYAPSEHERSWNRDKDRVLAEVARKATTVDVTGAQHASKRQSSVSRPRLVRQAR